MYIYVYIYVYIYMYAGGWFVLTFWANTPPGDKQRFLLSLYIKVGACILSMLLFIAICCPYSFAERIVGLVACKQKKLGFRV